MIQIGNEAEGNWIWDGQRQKNKIEEPASLYASHDRALFFNNPPAPTESSNQFFKSTLCSRNCEFV